MKGLGWYCMNIYPPRCYEKQLRIPSIAILDVEAWSNPREDCLQGTRLVKEDVGFYSINR